MSLPAKKLNSPPVGPLAPYDASRVPVASPGPANLGPFAAGYPKAFGPYALLKSFAHGGMGQVFLAQSGGLQGLEKLCVVKKLRADLTENREYVRRFLDEARVVVQLNHANICHVFDVGCVDAEYYLAMEYVAGVNLRALFHRAKEKQSPIAEPVALFALREVLEALDYAHRLAHPLTGQSLRLVHRDVSPQNVMLSYEGETKLIDFGLAASDLKEEHTQGDVVMGKVAYMSPEQARGEAIDAHTDQFAAAVLVYELLVGERYYGDLTTHQIWQVVGTGNFKPPSWDRLPRKLQTVLAKALSSQPRERYETCGDFSEELMGYLNSKSLTPSKRHMRAYVHELFAEEIERDRKRLASWMHHLHTFPSVVRRESRNPSLVETASHESLQSPAREADDAAVVAPEKLQAPAARQAPPRESTQRFEALTKHQKEIAQKPLALVESDRELENSSTLALVQMVMGPRWFARAGAWLAGGLLLALVVFAVLRPGADNTVTDVPLAPVLATDTPPATPSADADKSSSTPDPAASSPKEPEQEMPGQVAKKTPAPRPSPKRVKLAAAGTTTAPPKKPRKSQPDKNVIPAEQQRTKQVDKVAMREQWRDRVVKRLSSCPASCAQTLLGSSSALSTGHPLDVSEQDFRAISFTVERCLRSCEK